MTSSSDATRPTLVDNFEDGWSHEAALAALLERVPDQELCVATGYVSLVGLDTLAQVVDEPRTVRVLIGAVSRPDEVNVGVRLRVGAQFREQDESLRRERDRDNFPPARRARLERARAFLQREDVEVRRYTPQFLHGKTFIVGDEVTLCGSANLTAGGLKSNLELSLVDYNVGPTKLFRSWFDARWSEETEELTEQLVELLAPPPGDALPYDVFLRALDEFFGAEPEDEPTTASRLELARFQRDGYARAAAIADRYGGVVYADGTGLGKTYIGLRFVEEAVEKRREPAVVIVPGQLKRSFWGAAPAEQQLHFDVVTHDELAQDVQLAEGVSSRHLLLDKDHYRLVVVDEAQAFRNPQTARHQALLRLIGGSQKRVVLMSATPVNNSLWDLYHLISTFAASDNAFAESPLFIPSLERFFVRSGANDPSQLSPSRLFSLLARVAVGRPRTFVERYYEGDEIAGQPVRFPSPEYHTSRYQLDEVYGGLFEAIDDVLSRLRFARYQPARYLRPEVVRNLPVEEQKAAHAAAARERSLAGLLLSGLLKRFESSAAAARKTVEALIASHTEFLAAIERGLVPTAEELGELVDGDDGTLGALMDALPSNSTRHARNYRDELAAHTYEDLKLLQELLEEIREPEPGRDPKVAALVEILGSVPEGEKVVVFASFADTVNYIDAALSDDSSLSASRDRITIAGRDTTPEQRVRATARFAPDTSGLAGVGLPPGETEVDLLVSTDVLSEGQNLQQASTLVNFDLTWNPQRMVQRNGRINRLGGQPTIHLHTLAPDDAELERLLRLEARIRDKVQAANAALGMESRILDIDPEERVFSDVNPFGGEGSDADSATAELRKELQAEAAAGEGLDIEIEEAAGAAAERYRLELKRARKEGDLDRVRQLPFGIGSCFSQGAGIPSRGTPGVFFATRVHGERVWRYVTRGEVRRDELPMLQAIEPARATRPEEYETSVVLDAWELAEADILREFNEEPVDEPTIPPAQAWALELLAGVSLPGDQQREAAASLRVGRRHSVVRALVVIRRRLDGNEIDRFEAAQEVAGVVDDFGLRPTEPVEIERRHINADDIEVVCYCVVRPPGGDTE